MIHVPLSRDWMKLSCESDLYTDGFHSTIRAVSFDLWPAKLR